MYASPALILYIIKYCVENLLGNSPCGKDTKYPNFFKNALRNVDGFRNMRCRTFFFKNLFLYETQYIIANFWICIHGVIFPSDSLLSYTL